MGENPYPTLGGMDRNGFPSEPHKLINSVRLRDRYYERRKMIIKILSVMRRWCSNCKKYTLQDKVDGIWECRECS